MSKELEFIDSLYQLLASSLSPTKQAIYIEDLLDERIHEMALEALEDANEREGITLSMAEDIWEEANLSRYITPYGKSMLVEQYRRQSQDEE